MSMNQPGRLCFNACMALMFTICSARATPIVFTIDSTQSSVTLSGNLAGFTASAQGPGSLTGTNTGTIKADVTASTIQFIGSSQIISETNGTWQPAVGGGSGSAPADFGAEVTGVPIVGTAFGALRNVVLDVDSPVLPISGNNFDPSQLIFSFVTNVNATLDFNAGFVGKGSKSLSGLATNSVLSGASLTINGSAMTLIIHVNTTFTVSALSTGDSMVTLTGQLVATAPLSGPSAPVISQLTITNQSLVLSVQNAKDTSQLQSSTNLLNWQPASANVSSNGNSTVFTVPITRTNSFFRVQQ